jgi:membrane protein YdbS with pleckstrin-like domain
VTEAFSNEPIDVADLPRLRDEAFVSVDPRYLRASLLAIAAAAATVAIGGAIIASQSQEPWRVTAFTAALLGLLGLRSLFRTMEVRRLAYQVRAHDLSMRSGVITHRTASLPFARVQHVRIHRGAIERALGLATLHVSSAGPNIVIPGLADSDAERIKLLVTERAGDVEDHDAAVAADVPFAAPQSAATSPPPPTMPNFPPPIPTAPPPPAMPPPPAAPEPPPAPSVPPAIDRDPPTTPP